MDGNIEERILRLENKMKLNLFEIEKRMVRLETSSPTALNERIQELEDLFLLLQLENMRIKEKVSSADIAQSGAEEGMTELELSRGLPSNVEERLNYIENKISSFKGSKDEFENRLNEIESRLSVSGSVDREIANIEKRLDDLDKKVSFKGNISEDIENRLDELNNRILRETDRRLLEINNKINRIEVPSDTVILKSVEDRMDGLEKNLSLTVEESENISKTFEKRLNLLERESRFEEAGSENIEKKFNYLERHLSLLNKDVKKIDFLSKELSEIDKRLNLMELSEKSEKGTVLSEVGKILGGER